MNTFAFIAMLAVLNLTRTTSSTDLHESARHIEPQQVRIVVQVNSGEGVPVVGKCVRPQLAGCSARVTNELGQAEFTATVAEGLATVNIEPATCQPAGDAIKDQASVEAARAWSIPRTTAVQLTPGVTEYLVAITASPAITLTFAVAGRGGALADADGSALTLFRAGRATRLHGVPRGRVVYLQVLSSKSAELSLVRAGPFDNDADIGQIDAQSVIGQIPARISATSLVFGEQKTSRGAFVIRADGTCSQSIQWAAPGEDGKVYGRDAVTLRPGQYIIVPYGELMDTDVDLPSQIMKKLLGGNADTSGLTVLTVAVDSQEVSMTVPDAKTAHDAVRAWLSAPNQGP